MSSKALQRYTSYAEYVWQDKLVADLRNSPSKRCEPFRHCHAYLDYRGPYVILVSYNTPAAMAFANGVLHSVNPNWYSTTATRQVRWFLQDFCNITNP